MSVTIQKSIKPMTANEINAEETNILSAKWIQKFTRVGYHIIFSRIITIISIRYGSDNKYE